MMIMFAVLKLNIIDAAHSALKNNQVLLNKILYIPSDNIESKYNNTDTL